MALAHTLSDKVEAAYRRGDLFDKRKLLADTWANFCESKPVERAGLATDDSNIVAIGQPRKSAELS